MTDTTAKLNVGKSHFETMVDLDAAIKMRKGQKIDISEVIRDTTIWSDLKKGMRAGKNEIENAFGTTDFNLIVERIVKKGEIEVTQEFRDEAVEQKRKQIIDFFVKNAVDARTNRPFTAEMIESSLKQAKVKIDKQAIEKQIPLLSGALSTIIPLKIQTKKIKIIIPAVHTGRAYGIVQEYKESENWLGNGDLEVILNIPVGIQTEFYDKLNNVTHGSSITQEIKEKEK